MGLRSTIQKAAKSAVAATGDIAVSTNYHSLSSTLTYDASAGTNTVSYSTVAGVSVTFEVFSLSQIDGQNIQPEDKRALVPAKSISSITPKVNDQIKQSGQTWEVQGVRVGPAGALWDLQIRRP